MAKISREVVHHDLESDVVVDSFKNTVQYVRDNQNMLLAVVAIAAVLVIAVRITQSRNIGKVEAANLEMLDAATERSMALQATDDEQAKAQFAACEERLDNLITRYSGKPIGQRARVMAAQVSIDQLKFTAAREHFEMFGANAATDVDRARSARAIGVCWENESFLRKDASMLDKAMASYDEAISLGGESYIAYQTMIDKARLLAQNADTREEAIAVLERVVDERQEMTDAVSTKSAEEIEAMPAEDRPPARITLVQFAKERLEAVKALAAD